MLTIKKNLRPDSDTQLNTVCCGEAVIAYFLSAKDAQEYCDAKNVGDNDFSIMRNYYAK